MRGFLHLTALIGVGALAACGASKEDWPASRPKIDQLEFLQQSSVDPWALQFLIVYTDTDGDLGQGQVEVSVNGDLKDPQPLATVFRAQTPELPLDSTAGEFEALVKLSTTVPVGEEIEIGFVLQDGQGQRSNEPTVTLKAFAPGGGG